MATFSATTAALEGWHLIRREPVALAIWGGVVAIATAVAIGLIGATVGFGVLSHFPELMAASRGGAEPDPALALELAIGMASIGGILALVFSVVDAVLVTAVKRAVLRPEDRGMAYMRLGMDELRTFLVTLVRLIIMMVLWVISIILVVIAGRAIHPLVGVLLCLPVFPALLFVWVKLSLAVSQSFAERRFNLFGSWRLTHGQFWPLLGAYLLAIIFYLIVQVVLSTIAGALGGNALMAQMMQNPETFDVRAAGPAMVKFMLINVVAGIITKMFELPILGAPPAAAYRDIVADTGE